MKIKNLVFAISAAVILAGTMLAAALYWHPSSWKSAAGLESASNEQIWNAVSWRARLYLKKAEGGVPEISWAELWELTRPGSGFYLENMVTYGQSLESGLHFSATASETDRETGARIFRERCTGCHGLDGAGGLHGPSLARSGYKHGDSDLAIYKLLRNGIPGTAMPSAGLPLRELMQVAAYVKTLQVHSFKDRKAEAPRPAIQVSSERLQAAGANPAEWLTYSGSYNGWRHTSLTEITPANVAQLKLRWIKQFDTGDPFIETTPLVIDGTIFTVAPAPNVVALDAKSGEVIWEYARPIPPDLPLCCGRMNRGLAVQGSTIFLGSLDGYLVAIDANNGKVVWQTLVASPTDGYSITGAPLAINHSVVVGIAGGEFGTRGFLAAYDVSTGQLQWKFQTIPGPGEIGHETWQNDAWRTGGGPTWNTGSYDPSTGLIYWGVGNPSPDFAGDVRPGDNLFTNSVIALDASTGKLAWYFQFTPHDEHDWDSSQTPVLADLVINGVVRNVICWPNRNGFYYVLDRITGEFLVGEAFVEQDWAKGFTSAGRPIPSDASEASAAGRLARPGVDGGTNWQNPAFDQKRGSIFIPATESSAVFTKLPPARLVRGQQGVFVGSGSTAVEPPTRVVRTLDAATGRRKWEYISSPGARDYSGLLSTEGGLVFGASGGACFALDADTGRELWRVSLGGNTVSAPISFTIDGQQVIAVTAGRALFVFGL
ncbi:MAG TPA: PQQ-binding-like beta-propeller repeat protein [Methylocella sp.]|nr:PQQ-binding-like beta-propeller repeat protein [Methylocella sp.]